MTKGKIEKGCSWSLDRVQRQTSGPVRYWVSNQVSNIEANASTFRKMLVRFLPTICCSCVEFSSLFLQRFRDSWAIFEKRSFERWKTSIIFIAIMFGINFCKNFRSKILANFRVNYCAHGLFGRVYFSESVTATLFTKGLFVAQGTCKPCKTL